MSRQDMETKVCAAKAMHCRVLHISAYKSQYAAEPMRCPGQIMTLPCTADDADARMLRLQSMSQQTQQALS